MRSNDVYLLTSPDGVRMVASGMFRYGLPDDAGDLLVFVANTESPLHQLRGEITEDAEQHVVIRDRNGGGMWSFERLTPEVMRPLTDEDILGAQILYRNFRLDPEGLRQFFYDKIVDPTYVENHADRQEISTIWDGLS